MNALVVSSLLMGLFGGAHCVAMCGSASSAICGGAQARFPLAFNAGRAAGYVTLGAIVGTLGSAELGPATDFFRHSLRALAAVCMLAVGLHLLGLPSFVKTLEAAGAPLWRRAAPLAARLLPLRRTSHALLAGALWALMPCGLLYGALSVAASAASPAEGALVMGAFALGTLPVMLTLGLLARRLVQAFAHGWVKRAAGAVVLAFGLWSVAAVASAATTPDAPRACCPH